MENREMFAEINALVGAIAKAFGVGDAEVIEAIEQGLLGMEMMTDDQGRNCISASLDNQVARIYPGAIFREHDHAEEDCGGGCSCGH